MTVSEMVLSAMWKAAIGRGDEKQALLAEGALNATGNAPRQVATLPGAALWYAHRGIRVFPLQPGSKQPLPRSNGVKDATRDWDTITAMSFDGANIAVACGDPFDVLDIDNETGARSFLDVLGDGSWLDLKGVSETPRGIHFWVPAVEGAKNGKNEQTGIDYRTTGGYVVVPPSHINGTLYRWLLPPVL